MDLFRFFIATNLLEYFLSPSLTKGIIYLTNHTYAIYGVVMGRTRTKPLEMSLRISLQNALFISLKNKNVKTNLCGTFSRIG